MPKKAKTLESAMGELNDIIAQLEQEDVTLDTSIKLYGEGVKLLKYCNDSLDKVEKEIIILNEDGDKDEL